MKKIIMITLAGLLTTGNAFAGEVGQWYGRIGVAHNITNDSSDIYVNGFAVSGADIDTSDSTSASLDVGFFFDEHWSTSFVGVFPTESEITGADGIEGLNVGKFTYIPLHGFLNYHLASEVKFQPFIGAGFVYNHVSSVENGDVVNVAVSSDVGVAFRAGFDYMVDENWGTFASVNKSFVNHEITGQIPGFGGVSSVSAETELDPWTFQAGVTFRY